MPPDAGSTPAVFAALADPTRRQIFERLALIGSGTATALTVDFGISRQAIAKHLALLHDAGLATAERSGRETIYRPDLEPLHSVTDWVSAMESNWSTRLRRLSDHLTSTSDLDPG